MRIGLLHDGVVALTWEVNTAPVRVGRAPTNDLVLPHLDVSGHHAVLHARDGQLWATDLRSANGTFVDGVRIAQPTPMAVGARLRFGAHAELVVLDDQQFGVALLVERVDGLAAWPLPNAGVPLPGEQAAIVLEGGIPWLTSSTGDDRALRVDEVFEVEGVRYRVRSASPAATTERLDEVPPVELFVDLLGGEAVIDGLGRRCVIASDHRVALLHALGRRWLDDGGTPDAGWLDDEELAVAVWGRRYREQGSNNLHVLVHRVRSELAAAGLERAILQKRAGRTRVRVHRVVIR